MRDTNFTFSPISLRKSLALGPRMRYTAKGRDRFTILLSCACGSGPSLYTKVDTMSDEQPALPNDLAVTDRRGAEGRTGDRRASTERRQRSIPVAVERRSGKERRQEGERRRQVDPTTCERDYTDDEIEFMKSMDIYKRSNRRPFPTWSEVLEVMRALGYRKVAPATALPGFTAETAAEGKTDAGSK